MAERAFFTKINQLMESIGGYIQKDGQNVQQKYKYVSEGAVLSKVQPALVKFKLAACPRFELINCEDKATAKGAIWQLATVRCEITLIDVECPSDTLQFTGLGQGTDPGDKAIAKAETQAFKYAWWKFLCLETGDDPESDSRTDNATFTPAVPAPTRQQLPDLVVDPRSQVPMQELVNIWNYAGWDTGTLENYILQRFKHDQLAHVTPTEFTALISEMASYLSSIGKPVSVLPF